MVGISAGMLCISWLLHCGAPRAWIQGCAIGLLSFSFYSFYHFRTFSLLPISISLIGGVLFFIFNIHPHNLALWQWLTTIGFVALCLFYVFPNKKNIREIPFLKAPIIALVWVFFLFIFPLWNEAISPKVYQNEIIAFSFLYLGLTIPFDIRDHRIDKIAVRTLPQLIGVRYAKLIASLLILGFGWLMFLSTVSIEWIFYSLIVICFILFTNEHRKKSYFILIDSLMLLASAVFYIC